MLTFETEHKTKIPFRELEEMHISDAIEDDRDFKIAIRGEVFFHQTIAILELAQYCQRWIKEPRKDFIYNTIESIEAPIIAFCKQKNGWKLESVWSAFECNEVFSDSDIMLFITAIVNHVAE